MQNHVHTGHSAYIGNQWISSSGTLLESHNPATGDLIWRGSEATESEVHAAINTANHAYPAWSAQPAEQRKEFLLKFSSVLQSAQQKYAETISMENGKPLWESISEVASMLNKIDISILAYEERCQEKIKPQGEALSVTRHRPHGVMVVLGPFNFPGYLPLGQIVPALLAGNSVIFKPSELTPRCGEMMLELWDKVGLPSGVLNLIQGGRDTGRLLVQHDKINGVLFVGSWQGGRALANLFGERPDKMLALEMGGNNPLVVTDVADVQAAAYLIIQSAFLTAGQRCTCARRLIIPEGDKGNQVIAALLQMISKISIGPFTQKPEPYMGPVISKKAMQHLLAAQNTLKAKGATPLIEMKSISESGAFLTPGVIDVTEVLEREDIEHFGPLLQLIRVPDFESAMAEANNTAFGLTAGLLSDNRFEYERFLQQVHAGIINWNNPLTGNSSSAPFGGRGKSGNHRPSGYYTIDYCNDPIASLERSKAAFPSKLSPGLPIENKPQGKI